MTENEKMLYAVFNEVRICFNQLKSLAEQLHSDVGINPSMRAVMEALAKDGQQTVPEIARRRGVSRQHIQTIMNVLTEGALVDMLDNPAHKRSPHFALTAQGASAYRDMREREKKPLSMLAEQMLPEALVKTQETLTELNRQLEQEIEKGNSNEHSGKA